MSAEVGVGRRKERRGVWHRQKWGIAAQMRVAKCSIDLEVRVDGMADRITSSWRAKVAKTVRVA
jgi:hypothetical protein